MIQANELRIGNWINLSLREDISIYGKVLSIGSLEQEFEQVYCECEESFEWAFKDNYTGITLTPEILEKCGFVIENNPNNTNSFLCYTPTMNIVLTVCDNYVKLRHYSGIHKSIQYLHQLQNLYFALTGEELNYQP